MRPLRFGFATPVRFGITLCWVLGCAFTATVAPPRLSADVVTDWNATFLEATRIANTTPFALTRVGAIVHTAIFDAVNGVERRSESILVQANAPAGISLRAAANEAAAVTLTALFPSQAPVFAAQRAATLAGLAGTESATALAGGTTWGKAVAEAVLSARANDGVGLPGPPYVGGIAPGQWRPTASAFIPGAFTDYAAMKTWIIAPPSGAVAPAPPVLSSATYARDFNETKTMGGAISPLRSVDQANLARFWGTIPPAYLWNAVATKLALERRLPLMDTAKLLAVLNLSLADATIVCFYAKYRDGFWRPETAIAQAESDGNPGTAADPSWTPLLVTPPFPEHASAHSIMCAAAAPVLSDYFGDDTPFTVSSYALPGMSRSFATFSAAVVEAGDARVFGGMHFRSACDAGVVTGTAVAQEVMARTARTLPGAARVSARGFVGDGEQALIVGLFIEGSEPRRYLLRGVGPSLTRFGVNQPLANPLLRVYRGNFLLAETDDWSDPQVGAATARTGLVPLPTGSKDAAVIVTLAPGVHTVVVTGAAGEKGVALIEAYPLP